MGGLTSYLPGFGPKALPGTPIEGFGPRIKNIVKRHYRGILGVLVPIILHATMFEMHMHTTSIKIMWLSLLWMFLLQPVSIAVACMIPIFYYPMMGIIPSAVVVKNYMNENIQLLILSSALILVLNNSGADRRIALWFICSGDSGQFSPKRLVLKCSTAGFFLSMISNRLIASATIIQYAIGPLQLLSSLGSGSDLEKVRNILTSSVHTSCSIGSIAILHASPVVIAFKAMFTEYPGKFRMYPDCFNYLQYTVFAFPTAFILHVLNFIYHMILISNVGDSINAGTQVVLRSSYLKYKSALPKEMTLHEKYSVFFVILYLAAFFSRWSPYLNMGWADFSARISGGSKHVPAVKDTTVAALFLAILCTLPKSFNFLKVLSAKKKSDLPPLKTESAILWWSFVDKNIVYAYMFFIGTGISLVTGARDTGLGLLIRHDVGRYITDHSLMVALLIVCVLATVLTNILPGMAAAILLIPFVLCCTGTEGPAWLLLPTLNIWGGKQYLFALAVGLICSMSFMVPCINCPSFFARSVGKMNRKNIAKYGVGSAIISLIVIWLTVTFWAPMVWDPNGWGIIIVIAPYEGIPTTPAITIPTPEI